jgi:hypothetical protein
MSTGLGTIEDESLDQVQMPKQRRAINWLISKTVGKEGDYMLCALLCPRFPSLSISLPPQLPWPVGGIS